jgi:hypothetical protein
VTTAGKRAIDRIRRDRTLAAKTRLHAAAVAEAGDVEAALELVDRLEARPVPLSARDARGAVARLDRIDEARAAYERARSSSSIRKQSSASSSSG